DEQHLAAAITVFVVAAVLREEPDADWDLRRVEKLPRERHHAVDRVGLHHRFANLALAALVTAHAAIREDDASGATGSQVTVDVLQPSVVRVAGGRRAEVPALI